MAYRTSRAADEDIAKLVEHGVLHHGPAAAERYLHGLVRTFELIAAYPQIARERVEFVPPARVHAYRAHVIFYLIENEDVLILRVAGARQDWASQL